jgi:hypothetical protein
MVGQISDLRQQIVGLIKAVTVTAFQQGSITQTLKEARRPYAILDDSHARKHLLFSVDIPSVRFENTFNGNATHPYLLLADVRVQFLYRIRAADHDDEDKASDLAEAITTKLLQFTSFNQKYNILPTEIHSTTLTPDGESVLVEQRYSVRFDFSQ